RLHQKKLQLLLPFGQVSRVPLPLSLNAQPVWLIPSNSDQLLVGARGTIPIVMDVTQLYGDPEVRGVSFGNFSLAQVLAPELFPTFWFALPEPKGPFPPNGIHGQSVDLFAEVNAN